MDLTRTHAGSMPAYHRLAERFAAPWLALYGFAQVANQLLGPHEFDGAVDSDLMGLAGWPVVGLTLTLAAVAAYTGRGGLRGVVPLRIGAIVLAASCPILLLDVIGQALPGLGIPRDGWGFLSRLGCGVAAALTWGAATARRRRTADCLRCGRSGPITERPAIANWVYGAAVVTVLATLTRIGAQIAAGWGDTPFDESASLLVFEGGFLAAGVVLPALLVRTRAAWSRLLVWPAGAISLSLVIYFGVGLGQLALETIEGTAAESSEPFPVSFMWVAICSYLVWGLALGAVTWTVERATRSRCPVCGR